MGSVQILTSFGFDLDHGEFFSVADGDLGGLTGLQAEEIREGPSRPPRTSCPHGGMFHFIGGAGVLDEICFSTRRSFAIVLVVHNVRVSRLRLPSRAAMKVLWAQKALSQQSGVVVVNVEKARDEAGRFEVELHFAVGDEGMGSGGPGEFGGAGGNETPLDGIIEDLAAGRLIAFGGRRGGRALLLRRANRRCDEERGQNGWQPLRSGHEASVSHIREGRPNWAVSYRVVKPIVGRTPFVRVGPPTGPAHR